MKILFSNFHEGDGGGQTTYIINLAKQLKHDHQIMIAAPKHSRLEREANGLGIAFFPLRFKLRWYQWRRYFQSMRRLKQIIEKHSVDVLHVNGSADLRVYSMVKRFLKHIPKVVYTRHNSLALKKSSAQRLQACSDKIIAVCEYTATQLQAQGISHECIAVIYNGIDLKHYPYDPRPLYETHHLKNQYGIRNEEIVLGSVAGTASYKNWSYLTQALNLLKAHPFKVIIAGEAISKEDYYAHIVENRLENTVIFPGLFQDVREIIPVFDIGFVLSNAVETISFAAREMMAMGKPILVSEYAGLPENITPGKDGWIVPLDRPESLAELLSELMSLHKDHYTQMQEEARSKAIQHFSSEKFVQQTETIYKHLLENRE